MAIRIGIIAVNGRTGRLIAEETRAASADLAGGIGRPGGTVSPPADVPMLADLTALAAASDVVVDFTHATAARGNGAVLANAGKAWVLGTSGLSADDEAAVAAAAERIPVVYASNFSAGVNLVLALAERMGAALPADAYDAEIMEMHHRQKVDAPSGTAIGMGRAVAKGRGVKLDDVIESGRHGHTGARKTGAIGFAALRGGQGLRVGQAVDAPVRVEDDRAGHHRSGQASPSHFIHSGDTDEAVSPERVFNGMPGANLPHASTIGTLATTSS